MVLNQRFMTLRTSRIGGRFVCRGGGDVGGGEEVAGDLWDGGAGYALGMQAPRFFRSNRLFHHSKLNSRLS